jgi:hypothetical protein
MSANELNILPLRDSDLVFSKNRDGIVSCGYKVSNALLNSTLSLSMTGGNGGKSKQNDNELKTAKLMEDLVVPSSLYYCRPISKAKVFKYKKGKMDKGNKKENNSENESGSESDDNVIEESLYDKLLSLVSSDKKVKYDKKTRKTSLSGARKQLKPLSPNAKRNNKTGDETGAGENEKINIKNKKTRKVRFNE